MIRIARNAPQYTVQVQGRGRRYLSPGLNARFGSIFSGFGCLESHDNRMDSLTVLWIYIVLLVVGGLAGFFKAGSKASLIASVAFASALTLCAIGIIPQPRAADIILAVLLVFFGTRLAQKKKFMPNGMMVLLTVAALALRQLRL